MIAGALFTLALAITCVADVRTRRIPNAYVLVILVAGLVYSVARAPTGAGPVAGLGTALAAMGLGFVIWLPFHALRVMGAGDVKLFAAASAWLAPSAVLEAALVTALAGGALSLVWMLRSHGGAFTALRVAQMASVSGMRSQLLAARERGRDDGAPSGRMARLPYGVAMTVGLLAAAWLPYHLL